MTTLTVSGRVAQVLSSYLSDVFGVMGNGNVYFLDAAEQLGLRFSAVRHEGAAIAAADAYYRTSGRLAAGTTTYGPGYTNALTALAEAVQAQIPVVLVTGDAPSSGARPQDVDQAAIAAGLGAATFTVTRDAAGSITQQAVEYALTKRTAVVIAIPYDLAALEAADEELPAPLAPQVTDDVDGGLGQVARLLAGAKRPLILAGRGAHLAGAGPELRELADRLGALTAGTALALNLLKGEGYLGVAGGFGTDTAAGLMGEADVVLVAGASLSPFTMRFGHLLGPDSTVIQIDAALQPTHPRVDTFVSADVKSAAGRLLGMLDDGASADATARKRGARKPAGAWPKDRATTQAPTRPRTAGWTRAPWPRHWMRCCRSAARWSRTAGTSSAGHPCTGTSRGRRTWSWWGPPSRPSGWALPAPSGQPAPWRTAAPWCWPPATAVS